MNVENRTACFPRFLPSGFLEVCKLYTIVGLLSITMLSKVYGEETQVLAVRDFRDGLGPWGLNQTKQSLAQVKIESEEGGVFSACVEIFENEVQPYAVDFRYSNLKIDGSHTYRLRFRAKASSVRDIKIGLQEMERPYGTPWEQTISLEEEWRDFEIEALPSASVDGIRLSFLLGIEPGKVWFSDISLTEVK